MLQEESKQALLGLTLCVCGIAAPIMWSDRPDLTSPWLWGVTIAAVGSLVLLIRGIQRRDIYPDVLADISGGGLYFERDGFAFLAYAAVVDWDDESRFAVIVDFQNQYDRPVTADLDLLLTNRKSSLHRESVRLSVTAGNGEVGRAVAPVPFGEVDRGLELTLTPGIQVTHPDGRGRRMRKLTGINVRQKSGKVRADSSAARGLLTLMMLPLGLLFVSGKTPHTTIRLPGSLDDSANPGDLGTIRRETLWKPTDSGDDQFTIED